MENSQFVTNKGNKVQLFACLDERNASVDHPTLFDIKTAEVISDFSRSIKEPDWA